VDHCFCNQSCNLHEEADDPGTFRSEVAWAFDLPTQSCDALASIRHNGWAFRSLTLERKVVILASTYTYPHTLLEAKRFTAQSVLSISFPLYTYTFHIFFGLALLAGRSIVCSNLHDWSVHYISSSFLLQL
jgi:hypothetical protein